MQLVNTLVTKGTKSKVTKAHPGDICRVLASKKGKGERKVNMARFVWVTERNTEQRMIPTVEVTVMTLKMRSLQH
jgi:hypothetical protein